MTTGTDEATRTYIQSHLDEDLEEVAQRSGPPLIRPSLAAFLTPTGLFNLPDVTPAQNQGNIRDLVHSSGTSSSSAAHTVTLILQVMSVKDVSLSREQRSRALVHSLSTPSSSGATPSAALNDADAAASLADATLQAMEEKQEEEAQHRIPLRPSGGQWRCLRLELSDGFQRVLAVEDASARTQQRYGVLAKEGISLGAKLLVRLTAAAASTTAISAPCVQHGVLRLHAGNTEVMGGRVRALEVYWEEQARQHLAASTGRPSKQQQQQQQQSPNLADAPATLTSPVPAQQHRHPSQQRVAALPVSLPAPSLQQPQSLAALPVQPLRCWPAHAAQHPPHVPFCTVAFITEVVSDMVINEPLPGAPHNSHHIGAADTFTYSLLVQLSSPNAVERETQQQLGHSPSMRSDELDLVSEDDHLTVDLGHAWLHQLVGMPADSFRALSLSSTVADVELLTHTVEAVGHALEQFGKGRFTLVQRARDGIVEVIHAVPEP
ncbi:hypothetical protein, conserved [Leishmania tarentolae]|uniref:RecQ-mediated genome instability protein 1 n=1 Tax=Leishmania tarentolae TaxID=5689 RepID=A0A640KI93_LEITA|nr:hypothetical protein, conserved [Leishmania tarentolae]